MPVTTTRATHTVDLPLQSVWDAVVDHERMSTWGPGMRVTLDQAGTPERNGVGAVRRIAAPGPAPAIVEEITACDTPRRLGYRAVSGVPFRDYAGEVVLTDVGGRTEIAWSLSIRPRLGAERLLLAAVNRGLLLLLVRSLRG